MLPDRVSNPEPLTYESGTLPTALRGLAIILFFGTFGDNFRVLSGPVVQSIINLSKSLVKYLLSPTVLTKSTAGIFFAKTCKELLQCKSSSNFSAKNGSVFAYTEDPRYNDTVCYQRFCC